MTRTLDITRRPDVGPPKLRVTPVALRVLQRLRVEAGQVALLVAPRLSDEVLCVGLRDVTPGPNDALVATVQGCPIYVDRRDWSVAELSSMVLDARADLHGPGFVLRPTAGRST